MGIISRIGHALHLERRSAASRAPRPDGNALAALRDVQATRLAAVRQRQADNAARIAVQHNDPRSLRVALQGGAALSKQDPSRFAGHSLLTEALLRGGEGKPPYATVQLLLRARDAEGQHVDLLAKTNSGETAFHIAARQGPQALQTLLDGMAEGGADYQVNEFHAAMAIRDNAGRTPFDSAMHAGHVDAAVSLSQFMQADALMRFAHVPPRA